MKYDNWKNTNQKMGRLMYYRPSKTTRAEQKTFLLQEQTYWLNPGRTCKEEDALRRFVSVVTLGTSWLRPKPGRQQRLPPFTSPDLAQALPPAQTPPSSPQLASVVCTLVPPALLDLLGAASASGPHSPSPEVFPLLIELVGELPSLFIKE